MAEYTQAQIEYRKIDEDEAMFVVVGSQQLLDLAGELGISDDDGVLMDQQYVNLIALILLTALDGLAEGNLEDRQRLLGGVISVLTRDDTKH